MMIHDATSTACVQLIMRTTRAIDTEQKHVIKDWARKDKIDDAVVKQ